MDKYTEMNRTELRQACKAAGIAYGSMTKEQMLEALRAPKAEKPAKTPKQSSKDQQAEHLAGRLGKGNTAAKREVAKQAAKDAAQAVKASGVLESAKEAKITKVDVDKDGRVHVEVTEQPSKAPNVMGAMVAQMNGTLKAPEGVGTVSPSSVKRTSSGLKIDKDRPEQNGVRRQSPGSVGDRLWALYDAAGHGITLADAKAAAEAAGLSPTSAAIALYNWRKFHGIASR